MPETVSGGRGRRGRYCPGSGRAHAGSGRAHAGSGRAHAGSGRAHAGSARARAGSRRAAALALAALALAAACLLAPAPRARAATIWSDGFESGLGKWTTHTNVSVGAGGNPGQCAWFTGSGSTQGTLRSGYINVNASTTYYLSVDYRYPGAGGYVQVQEYAGSTLKASTWLLSDNAGVQTALQYFDTPGTGWSTYTQSWKTTATTTRMRIRVIGYRSGTTHLPPYFDNVNLSDTPPTVPATRVKWEEVTR